ncbi:MAG: hypothetical protein V1926_05425 [Candidatus Peregrinibacteria bacterium]
MEDQPHIQKRVWAVVGIACAAMLTGILSVRLASRAYISPGEFMEAFGGVGAASSAPSSQASSQSTPPIPSLFDIASGTPPLPSLFHPASGAPPIPSLSDVMADIPPIPSLAGMNTSSTSAQTGSGGSRTVIHPLYPAYRSHFGQSVSPALRTINPIGTITSSSSRGQVTIVQNVVTPQASPVTSPAPQAAALPPGSHALVVPALSSASSVSSEILRTTDAGTPFADLPVRAPIAGTAQPIGFEPSTAVQGGGRQVLAQVIPPVQQSATPASGTASPLTESGASPILLALVTFFGILGAHLVRTRRQDAFPSP